MRIIFSLLVGLVYAAVTWVVAWGIILFDNFISPLDIFLNREYNYLGWGILGVFVGVTIMIRVYLLFVEGGKREYNRFRSHKSKT
jgi:hypothetical protein